VDVIVVVLISLILLAAAWIWAGQKLQHAYTLEGLETPISLLLKKGLGGAFIVITEEKTNLWIQLRKYFNANEEAAIEIAFPNAPWSFFYFEKLRQYLLDKNIFFEIHKEGQKEKMEFLYIDCKSDVEKAKQLVSEIFVHIFEITGEANFNVKGSAVTAFAFDIDRSEHQPKTINDTLKAFFKKK